MCTLSVYSFRAGDGFLWLFPMEERGVTIIFAYAALYFPRTVTGSVAFRQATITESGLENPVGFLFLRSSRRRLYTPLNHDRLVREMDIV